MKEVNPLDSRREVAVVTGAAGFIGSHIVDRLLAAGYFVLGIDNMLLGRESNLDSAAQTDRFQLIKEDLSLAPSAALNAVLSSITKDNGISQIWHMAANSDIAKGAADPDVDLQHTFMTTFNVLGLAKRFKAKEFFFASSSAVYGNRDELLLETSGPLLPISNYGAMKLGSEGLVSAAVESFLSAAVIFRFPNVVGTRGTHGVIYDFIQRLKVDPLQLTVLGNGEQTKPYLHVLELVDAMFLVADKRMRQVECVNIGVESGLTSVKFIAEEVVRQLAPKASIRYTGGAKGWVGDVPRFKLSNERIYEYGWKSQQTSDEAVRKAIREIISESKGVAV